MATTIDFVSERKVFVNGKTVTKDMNNKWVASLELTTTEAQALNADLTARNLL